MLKVFHCGDFHPKEKDIEEARKVLSFQVSQAAMHQPDLIAIAGDLTDRNDIKFDSQVARLILDTVSQFSMVAPVAIVTGTKIHDGNIPELLDRVKQDHPVYVANYPDKIVLTEDGGFSKLGDKRAKAIISFVPAPTKQFFNSTSDIQTSDFELGQAMSAIFAEIGAAAGDYDLPHVMLGHWTVRGAHLSETQQMIGRDIEITVEQLLSARVTVGCLGHIHMAQQIGNHPFFYCGSAYRKDHGEKEEKGFYIHTISGTELIESAFIRSPARKLVRIKADFTKEEPKPLPTPEDVDGAAVRIDITVWQDEREQINKQGLEETFLSAGADTVSVHITIVPRQNVRAASVLQVERLRDKVKARAEMTGDEVSESILAKCDLIEDEPREVVLKQENGKEKAAA